MQKVLFVCTQNRLRSPTAENIFSELDGIQVKSAGTDSHARIHLTSKMIEWADIIFAMEKIHEEKIKKKFRKKIIGKKIVVLNIPDNYDYMQPELISLLKKLVPKHLNTLK